MCLLSHGLGPGLDSLDAKYQCKFTSSSSGSEVGPSIRIGLLSEMFIIIHICAPPGLQTPQISLPGEH